jgi:lactate dehydrogenase-like 2-hydroxyacid dehydrogenase
MRERFDLQINADDSILNASELVRAARGSELLFISATEVVDKVAIAELAPELRVVATLSVGFDHIDLDAARAAGVRVLHTPDVLSDACAEIALMLVLNACRRGYEADRMVRSGTWPGWGPTQLLGMGLAGKRMGIFGMGRIGKAIAARARAFGLDVHYHNRTRAVPDDGAVYHETLDSLLRVSDILMIAAPGAPSLRGVIDADRIERLPFGAVVVNISRGDLVDDDALVAALRSGRLRGAGLDVFANEPNIHPGYRALDNVFLTPHIGSATDETRDAMGWLLIQGAEALARGEAPKNLLC